jgi:L-amino acid N-acyltransferase YncA
MIRPATNDDIPRIIELGRLLHQSSSYAAMEFDEGMAASFIEQLISGVGVVFVAEIDGVVVGGIAGGITEQWFSSELLAFDYSFFIDPKTRSGITATKLVRAFTEWARLKGAKHIQIGITTDINVEGTSRFYRALGFEDAGLFFNKEL